MGQVYKSTITIYSSQDWSGSSIVELAQDINNGSICQIWTVDRLSEKEIYQEEHAEEILVFFGISSDSIDPKEHDLYDDDDYEFYSK